MEIINTNFFMYKINEHLIFKYCQHWRLDIIQKPFENK